MRIIILVSFTLLLNSIVTAQDIIVAKNADTLKCEIDKILYDKVQFSFKNENGAFVFSELKKEDLTCCYFNYDSLTKSGSKYVNFEREDNIFFVTGVLGISGRLSEVTSRGDGLSDDRNKRGLFSSVQIGYYIRKKNGFGITYISHSSKTSFNNSFGSIGIEKIKIRYFAPTLFIQHIVNQKFVLQTSFSAGLISYNNMVEPGISSPVYEYFGRSIGAGGHLYLGFNIARTIRLSLVAGAVFGKVSVVELKNENLTFVGPPDEDLSSIDLGISMTFLIK